MTQDRHDAELMRLDDVVTAFGADPRRWPPARADALRALAARDLRARRLVGEAAALDRLIAEATEAAEGGESASGALTDRILASLPQRLQSRPAVVAATVVRLDAARGPRVMPKPTAPALRAATLLAASLILGLVAGVAGHDHGLLREFTTRLGIGSLVGGDVALNGDGVYVLDEEDML